MKLKEIVKYMSEKLTYIKNKMFLSENAYGLENVERKFLLITCHKQNISA